jgi:Xaa-Pro dipeptidase
MVDEATAYYRAFYPRFSHAEYQRRYSLVRDEMRQRGVDCLVISGSPGMAGENMADVFWLSNWDHPGQEGYITLPADEEATLFCSLGVYRPNALQRSVIEDVRPGADVSSRIRELKLGRGVIGVVGGRIPHVVMEQMRLQLPDARFIFCDDWFGELRRAKSDEELRWLSKGAELTDLAMDAVIREIRPGITERQLQGAAARAASEAGGKLCFQWLGSTPMSRPMMVYPSPEPSNRPIQKGDLIITEISAAYESYPGQIIRYIAVGQEPSPDYLDLHVLTVQLYKDLCAALTPGNTPAIAVQCARPLIEAGYHVQILAIGRPTGAATPPILLRPAPTPFDDKPFLENETVMVLPMPFKTPDRMGLFLGNLVQVTRNGGHSLQKYPLEDFVVVDF